MYIGMISRLRFERTGFWFWILRKQFDFSIFFLIWKNDSIASDYKDPYSSKIMWVNMKDVLNFSLLWLFKSTFGHRLNLTDYPLKGY